MLRLPALSCDHAIVLKLRYKNKLPIAAQRQKYYFSTTGTRDNPYSVLNIPSNSNFETVKAAFIKAALKHHPDHSKSPDSTAEFVRIRQAFEKIITLNRENRNSTISSDANTNHPEWKSDADFHDWFKMATREYLTFEMNHQTRNEVIHTYRTMSSGGLDRGGHWEMARQLTERQDAFLRAGGCTTTDSEGDKSTNTSLSCDSIRRRRKR